MPTNLDRIQCLLQPKPYAQVRTLASHNRRALSAMAAELIEYALKQEKYRDQLEEADVQVPEREDPRTAIKQTAIKAERQGQSYADLVTDLEAEKVEKLKKLLSML